MEIEILYGNGEHYVDITGAAVMNWYDRINKCLTVPASKESRMLMVDEKVFSPNSGGGNFVKVTTGTMVLSAFTSAKVTITGPVKIWYGAHNIYANVTDKVFKAWGTADVDGRCVLDIPAKDAARTAVLGDPIYGSLKHIKIVFEESLPVTFLSDGEDGCIMVDVGFVSIAEKVVNYLHTKLRISGGDMKDEYPEQLMVARYLNPQATVLELGSNIGRNSLIIGSILDNSSRLVTVECDVNTCKQLKDNRNINGLNFHVCEAALSLRRLAQKGWETMVLEPGALVANGYVEVPTTSYQELKSKCGLTPDTLVVDVEGAMYYIVQDMPEILDDVNTIIIENDYPLLSQKLEMDARFIEKGFKLVFQQPGPQHPCQDCFYEVWLRRQ